MNIDPKWWILEPNDDDLCDAMWACDGDEEEEKPSRWEEVIEKEEEEDDE